MLPGMGVPLLLCFSGGSRMEKFSGQTEKSGFLLSPASSAVIRSTHTAQFVSVPMAVAILALSYK